MKDNKELDGTPLAHPAFIRGCDHTVKVLCQAVNNILDGKDDGRGVASEPWETLRKRLINLHLKAATQKEITRRLNARKSSDDES